MKRLTWFLLAVVIAGSGCATSFSDGELGFTEQCTEQSIAEEFRTETLLPVPVGFEDWRQDSFILRFDRSDARIQVIDRRNQCVAEITSAGSAISQRVVEGGIRRPNWFDSPFIWIQQAGLEHERRIAECSKGLDRYISFMVDHRGYSDTQVAQMIEASYIAEMNECDIIVGYDYTFFVFEYENQVYSLEIQGDRVFFGREQ